MDVGLDLPSYECTTGNKRIKGRDCSTMSSGLICAIGSAAFNGSFVVPYKHKSMVNVKPLVFQFYCATGVMLSGFFVIPFFSMNEDIEDDDEAGNSFVFSGLGFLAGIIFVCSMALSFSAVELNGLALSQALWSGVAIIVSYLWGVVILGDAPQNIGVSISGVIVLVFGVIIIAFSSTIANRLFPADNSTPSIQSPLTGSLVITKQEIEYGIDQNDTNSSRYQRGLILAFFVGIFGGSILAPLNFVPPEQSGLVFVPSFGIGAFTMASVILACVLFSSERINERLEFNWSYGLPLGILSGTLFQLSNILSIVAIPALGYGVAYPLLQCAILFSGIWGVFVFKEITGVPTISIFFLGGAILLGGAAMLAIAQ